MHRFLRTLIIGALVLPGVVGCQSRPEAPKAPDTMPTAEGFAPVIDSSNLIFVIPVDGVNGAASLVLADAVAASLRDARKPAILAGKANELGPTVVGVIAETEQHGSVVWVTAQWELQDRAGVPVDSYRHQVVVDERLWQAGAAEAINLLAADAGVEVTRMVRQHVVADTGGPRPTTAAAPVRLDPGPPVSETGAETGAPTVAQAPAPPAAEVASETPALSSLSAAVAAFADPPGEPPAPSAPGRVAPLPAERVKPPPPLALTPKKKPTPIAKAVTVAKVPPPKKPVPVLKKAPPPKPRQTAPARPPAPKPQSQSRSEPLSKPQSKSGAKPKPVLMPVPEDATAGLVPDPPPVKWGRPSFLIKPVAGVSDAGNQALMRAMKDALRKRDLTVTEDPRQAGYVIAGTVEIGPAVAGRQRAKIVWVVNTIDGDEVGKAVQENAVKAGSLDGAWGRVADIVSNAAVVGIQELFGIDEKQSTRLQAPPFNPDHPNLPRMPGRALPPPK